MIMVLLPFLCNAQNFFIYSRATFYGSPDCLGSPRGACGYGEYGRTVNDAYVAGVSRLYRNGTGCGACYQLRCKIPQLCTDEGVSVVVTDYGEGHNTDFILNTRAYARLSRPNMALELMAYGVVDIEYKRISCNFPGSNLLFKVHEKSAFPHYLAIVALYAAGQNDIIAVEIWLEEYKEWRCMRRAYGAVWDIENPPRGAVTLRFQVSGSSGQKWVQLQNVIPSDWKAGATYDSTIQLT